jgi:threonine dehydratase
MRMMHQYAGLVVEPAGAVGVAAILMDPSRYGGRVVATILCGGNVSPV